MLAQPDRIGVGAEVIQRTLDGRLKISPDGTSRESGRYLLVGREGAARPDPGPGRLALCADGALGADGDDGRTALKTAMAVFRPDLYDAALGRQAALRSLQRRSAPSPARRSIPATSRGIWRPSRSGTGSPEPACIDFRRNGIIG